MENAVNNEIDFQVNGFLRVVSWNIDRPASARLDVRIADLIDDLRPDIALLQEVSAANVRRLVEAFGRDRVDAGCILRPMEVGETTSRDRGCAIIYLRRVTPLGKPSCLSGHCAPERSLIRRIRFAQDEVDVASFHQVAGSDRKWGRLRKRQVFDAISSWAVAHPKRALFGIDANSPETDHPDVGRNRYFPVRERFDQHEYLLHDPARAPHHHEDSFRRYLRESAPDLLDEITSRRPNGPLAISHVNRGIERRFDFVYAAPDLKPVRVVYREDLRRGANEHAPVVADLVLL
jgi:hypothetical protein